MAVPEALRITPSRSDILSANPERPTSCAIVRFINRVYPQYTYVDITDRTIAFSDPGDRIRYKWATPLKVGEWLQKFDTWLPSRVFANHPELILAELDGLDFYLYRDRALKTPMPPKVTPQRARVPADLRPRVLTPEQIAEKQKESESRARRRRRGA